MRRLRYESEDLQEVRPFAHGRKALVTRENGCGDLHRRSRSFWAVCVPLAFGPLRRGRRRVRLRRPLDRLQARMRLASF